eukprot:gene6029-8301_t
MISEKSLWVSSMKKSMREFDLLEKKLHQSLGFDDLMRERAELTRNRIDAIQLTQRRIENLKGLFRKLKEKLQEPSANSNQNQTTLRRMLENFENKLTSFKLLMKGEFDILEESCCGISDELAQLASDIDSWDLLYSDVDENQLASELNKKGNNQNNTDRDIERKAIIGGIDRKIAALGKYDGWDVRDHDCFVKVWNQVIGTEFDSIDSMIVSQKSNLLKKMNISLIGINQEKINDHIDWYYKYLQLTTSKKRLLLEWKKDSIQHKSNQTNDALNLGEISNNFSRNLPIPPPISTKDNSDQQLAVKEKIARWKSEKQKEQIESQMEKNREVELEKKISEEEKRKRQISLRNQLEQWKSSEDAANDLLAESDRAMGRKYVDPEIIKKRNEKDLEFAKTKYHKVEQALKKNDRESRLKQLAEGLDPADEKIKNNPDRLYSSTKAYEAGKLTAIDLDYAEKRRSSASSHSSTVAMTGRDLKFTGRAIPTWCKPPK